ncbi:MAG: LamG domain-containing protein, partial [Sedimentisphaerales bacterium]|nr:LamG domain-containing protein [Sedimentisphaerales bacterium]
MPSLKNTIILCVLVFAVGSLLVLVDGASADITDGLVGYWPYDGNTDDASGLGNDGIAVNSPSYVSGKFGSALDFNGSNQYVTMDAVANDFSGNDVTMSGWLKTTETGEGDWFSNNGTNGQYLLCNYAGEPRMYEGGWRIYAGVTINDNTWHHVVVTRESMVVKLYVDGVQRGGTYTSTVGLTASDRWSIAQEWDGSTASDFYDGIVDEAALWDRVLSTSEISWLWNSGDGNLILGTGNAVIVESDENTEVTEGGATDNYTIKLDSIPTDPVMITATPSDAQIDLGSGAGTAVTLTFTAATWNTLQTITVTAYDDDVYEGKAAHITDITHSAASDDSNYD